MMNSKIELDQQLKGYEFSFLIENMLRVSVHNILVKRIGINYFTIANFPEYSDKSIRPDIKLNIVQKAKQLKAEGRLDSIPHYKDYPLLWYLDYRILISMVNNFWDSYFFDLFNKPKLKISILDKLNSISNIRNSIAHNRFLNKYEINETSNAYNLLKISIKNIYLENFEDIVFNPIEKRKDILLNLFDKVISLLNGLNVIDRRTIRNINSLMSDYLDIYDKPFCMEKLEEIKNLIDSYNGLPRKPATGYKIRSFLTSSDLIEKLITLKKSMEG